MWRTCFRTELISTLTIFFQIKFIIMSIKLIFFDPPEIVIFFSREFACVPVEVG